MVNLLTHFSFFHLTSFHTVYDFSVSLRHFQLIKNNVFQKQDCFFFSIFIFPTFRFRGRVNLTFEGEKINFMINSIFRGVGATSKFTKHID